MQKSWSLSSFWEMISLSVLNCQGDADHFGTALNTPEREAMAEAKNPG
jgi:hypothetical protein